MSQSPQEPQTPTTEIPGLLGPAVGYIDLLDAAIVEKKLKEREKGTKYNPLRPSAAGKCARALAHEFEEFRGLKQYPQEEVDPNLERLFALGHSVEYSLIRQFESAPELFRIKYKQQCLTFQRISETELVEGSNDLCIYIPGHKCIADVKSKGTKFSSYRESSWDEIDDKLRGMTSVTTVNERVYWVPDLPAFLRELNDPFFEDNFVQLNLYATSEFMQERGIDHALILQYEKNKSRLREIRFKPSQEIKEYVDKKFLAVANAIDSGAGPEVIEKESFIGSMRCSFCRFKEQCWPEQDAKKMFFKNLPPKKWPKDTDRLGDVGGELEALYTDYAAGKHTEEATKVIETKIIETMQKNEVDKIRFASGAVYELKFLKTPWPHFELRRSKV